MKSRYQVGDLIYDAGIYDGMNTGLADLEFYKRWMPKNKDARILELCCGTGRLTIPLAREGYVISGVDFTTSMLEQAKTKAAGESLKVEFIEADIRTLDLPEKYDLIFIPFNSIHHLYTNEDLFKAFHVVKDHLKEGGLFSMTRPLFFPPREAPRTVATALKVLANQGVADPCSAKRYSFAG